jgi:hypothetical protein
VQPGASVAISMVSGAGRGWCGLVEELGAAGTGRTCGAGQGGDVDLMSAHCRVDALSGGEARCGGLVTDRVVEPVNGAGV